MFVLMLLSLGHSFDRKFHYEVHIISFDGGIMCRINFFWDMKGNVERHDV